MIRFFSKHTCMLIVEPLIWHRITGTWFAWLLSGGYYKTLWFWFSLVQIMYHRLLYVGVLCMIYIVTSTDWHTFSKTILSEKCRYILRPRQNGRHFPDDIYQCIFLNENIILIGISLNFVPKGPINNIPALVQIVVWRRSGDKPLSESLMVSLLAHICITRPQWVNMNISTFIVILDKAFTEWKQLNYNQCLSQIHMWVIATSLQILIKHIPRILT